MRIVREPRWLTAELSSSIPDGHRAQHRAPRPIPCVLSSNLLLTSIRREEAVELGIRHEVRECSEAAVRPQLVGGTREPGPRRQCERTTYADPPHAECRDAFDIQPNVTNHEEVERLGRHRFDERLDFCRVLWARSEEHVSPRRSVGLQTPDRFAERIGMTHVVTLGSRRQQNVLARSVDGLSRSANALDCGWQLVKRRCWITG